MIDRPPAATDRSMSPPTTADADGWARCLAQVLDTIDHGVVLLDRAGHVHLANARARQELDGEHPLQMTAGQLQARHATDAATWRHALGSPQPRRPLLTLGDGARRVSVALLPLAGEPAPCPDALVLLMGCRQGAADAALQAFATHHALTPAETRVLAGLCAGTAPARIAQHQGVRISTVRTQIASLREKTGARGIPELVRSVALLPPLRASAASVNRSQEADPGFPRSTGDDFLS